jgi:hypothetical protein
MVLFTKGCPLCVVLEEKLTQKGVVFEKSEDFSEIEERGFTRIPVLKVDGDTYLDFSAANKYVDSI